MKALVLHFNFGHSFQNNIDVMDQIRDRLPATISLAVGSAVIFLVLGIFVGIISGTRPRSLLDRFTMGTSLIAISAPVYWLGLVSLFLFANDIGKVKIFEGAGSYAPLSEDPSQWFGSLILPWLVLAASFTAVYARLLRSNLMEVLS